MPLILEGNKQHVPVKSWAPFLDIETEVQLRQVAMLPFVRNHVAAMPDAHKGKGSTVGTVIATARAIIPAAIGVDIGCGMLAFMTNLNFQLCFEKQWDLFNALLKYIPVGQTSHDSQKYTWSGFKEGTLIAPVGDYWDGAKKQLGTMGGGNHFLEMCYDADFNVWIVLHSGSRKIGNEIGNYYIKTAQRLMKEGNVDLPNGELAYLLEKDKEFSEYINDMMWAQEYAMFNRSCMLDLASKAIKSVVGDFNVVGEVINCHHNYTVKEIHHGEEVWLTRKGAIRAQSGEMGIIPGSMGSETYIVRGKGCAEAFCSAPHGGGRLVPRGAAKRKFTVEDVVRETEGIACKKDASMIDEIPSVYKGIKQVMEHSADLVEVVAELKQFVNVKG